MDNADQFHSASTVGLFTQFQGQIWASLGNCQVKQPEKQLGSNLQWTRPLQPI